MTGPSIEHYLQNTTTPEVIKRLFDSANSPAIEGDPNEKEVLAKIKGRAAAVYSITAFLAGAVYVNKANTQSVMQQCEGDNAVRKKRLCITKANGDIPLPCDIRGRFDFLIYRTTDPLHAYIVEHICITQYGITFTACNVKGHLDGGPAPKSDQNHYVCVTYVPTLVTGVVTGEYKFNPQAYVLLGNHTGRTMLTSDHPAPEPTVEGIVAYYADKILGPHFRQLAVTDPSFDAVGNKDVCDALLKWGTDNIRKILTQAEVPFTMCSQ